MNEATKKKAKKNAEHTLLFSWKKGVKEKKGEAFMREEKGKAGKEEGRQWKKIKRRNKEGHERLERKVNGGKEK